MYWRRVYPRVCGEALNRPTMVKHEGGLSPRVRGSLVKDARQLKKSGSIPACAGKPA